MANVLSMFLFLFSAVICLGNKEILKMLLQAGANPNVGDSLPIVQILARIKSGAENVAALTEFLSISKIKVRI